MSLAKLIQSVESDLSRNLPRNLGSFAEARARRPELAPFATLADLRVSLAPSSSALSTVSRRSLVTALVAEAQRGTSQAWASLLVVAFGPMLHRLRSHAGPPNDLDLDGAVLVAFVAAIRAVRTETYTSLALRWATEKEVVRGRIAERRLGTPAEFDENLHSNPTFHETEQQQTFDEVLSALEERGAAEILDVLIATRGRDESLRAYVFRTCPNPRQRGARYEHLCRARQRFERELRERMPRAA